MERQRRYDGGWFRPTPSPLGAYGQSPQVRGSRSDGSCRRNDGLAFDSIFAIAWDLRCRQPCSGRQRDERRRWERPLRSSAACGSTPSCTRFCATRRCPGRGLRPTCSGADLPRSSRRSRQGSGRSLRRATGCRRASMPTTGRGPAGIMIRSPTRRSCARSAISCRTEPPSASRRTTSTLRSRRSPGRNSSFRSPIPAMP